MPSANKVLDLERQIAQKDKIIASLKNQQSNKDTLDVTTKLRRELARANSRAEESRRELEELKAHNLTQFSSVQEQPDKWRHEVQRPKKEDGEFDKQEKNDDKERELRERLRHLETELDTTKQNYCNLLAKLSPSRDLGDLSSRKNGTVRSLGQVKVRDDLEVDYRSRASITMEGVAPSTPLPLANKVCDTACASTTASPPPLPPTARNSAAATRGDNSPRPSSNALYNEHPTMLSHEGLSAVGDPYSGPLPLTAGLFHEPRGETVPGPPIDDTSRERLSVDLWPGLQSTTVVEARPKTQLTNNSNKGRRPKCPPPTSPTRAEVSDGTGAEPREGPDQTYNDAIIPDPLEQDQTGVIAESGSVDPILEPLLGKASAQNAIAKTLAAATPRHRKQKTSPHNAPTQELSKRFSKPPISYGSNVDLIEKIRESYRKRFSKWSSNIADQLVFSNDLGSATLNRYTINLCVSGKSKAILDDQTWAKLKKQGVEILSFFPTARSPNFTEEECRMMRGLSGKTLPWTERNNSHYSQKPCTAESHDVYSRLNVVAHYLHEKSKIAQDEKRVSKFFLSIILRAMEHVDEAKFDKYAKNEFSYYDKSKQAMYQRLLSLIHSLSAFWQSFHLPLLIYLLRSGIRRLNNYFCSLNRPAAVELLVCQLNDPDFCTKCLSQIHSIPDTIGFKGSTLLGVLQNHLEVQSNDQDLNLCLRQALGYFDSQPSVKKLRVEGSHDEGMPESKRERRYSLSELNPRSKYLGQDKVIEVGQHPPQSPALTRSLKRKRDEGIQDKRLRLTIEPASQEDPQAVSRTGDWDPIRRRIHESTHAKGIATLLPGEKLNDEAINKILRLFNWSPDVQLLDTFFLHRGYNENWTPNASILQVRTMVKQLVIPLLRNDHWSLLCVRIGDRTIDHYDSWLTNHPIPDHQGCGTCQLMGQTVDKALESAQIDKPEPLDWTFRTQDEQNQGSPLSQQQTNGMDCGVYLLLNAYYLSRGLKPCQERAMPDEWRLRWAQQLLHEADDVPSRAETPDTESVNKESPPLKRSTVDFQISGAIPSSDSPETMPQTINEKPVTMNGSQPPDDIEVDDTISPDGIFNPPSTMENTQQGSTGTLLPLIEGHQIHHDSGHAMKDTKFEVDKTATVISTQETNESTLEAVEGTAAFSLLQPMEAASDLDSRFLDFCNEISFPGDFPVDEGLLEMDIDWGLSFDQIISNGDGEEEQTVINRKEEV